jgi:hypothetical protein
MEGKKINKKVVESATSQHVADIQKDAIKANKELWTALQVVKRGIKEAYEARDNDKLDKHIGRLIDIAVKSKQIEKIDATIGYTRGQDLMVSAEREQQIRIDTLREIWDYLCPACKEAIAPE